MKINPTQISKVLGVYASQKASSVKANKPGKGNKDQVVLSKEAQAFQTAMKAVKESPDVQTARVEEIKARMEAGQYRVGSREIAEKIVGNVLSNHNRK